MEDTNGLRDTGFEDNLLSGSPLNSGGERRFFGQTAWELLKVAVVSLAIVLPIRYFVFQPFTVQGQSMEPNFQNKDYLIIDELSYYVREPQRGEVVVFKYPYDTTQYYIKRVIGLPGERIVIRDGGVMLFNKENPEGIVVKESYLPADLKTLSYDNKLDVTVGEGEYFLLGDNRGNSSDSRIFGPVKKSFLIGRVWLRGLPLANSRLYSDPIAY